MKPLKDEGVRGEEIHDWGKCEDNKIYLLLQANVQAKLSKVLSKLCASLNDVP